MLLIFYLKKKNLINQCTKNCERFFFSLNGRRVHFTFILLLHHIIMIFVTIVGLLFFQSS